MRPIGPRRRDKVPAAEGELLEEVILDLQLSIRESGDVTIVDLRGRATIGVDNDLLNRHLRKLVANGVRKLLLNLADVTQVDSSSIATIAGTFVSLSRQDGSLKLLRPRGRVLVVLGVMRLLDSIPTFENETQALASFRPRGYSART
jgi:anti-anti-sigma factor